MANKSATKRSLKWDDYDENNGNMIKPWVQLSIHNSFLYLSQSQTEMSWERLNGSSWHFQLTVTAICFPSSSIIRSIFYLISFSSLSKSYKTALWLVVNVAALPLPPNSPAPLVQFRFQECTISKCLKLHRLCHCTCPAEDVHPAPAQEVQPASGNADSVLLCNNPVRSLFIHHCLNWIGHRTQRDYNGQSGLQRKLVPASNPFRTFTHPDSGNEQETSLQTHRAVNTTCPKDFPPRRTRSLCQKNKTWEQFVPYTGR